MARDDPNGRKNRKDKDKRKDIRDDGRPLPLKHQSARGETPRNSGNFVRGSQLLNTQVLMWLQGAKMPVFLWLILFGLAYFAIVSLSLTEIHFQLICMRALSTVWTWVGADPLHHINLKMPGGYTRSVPIGYVPYVPAVAMAWHKGVHDLLSSILLATILTVPVSVWYVDFSAKRGKAIVQERREPLLHLVHAQRLHRLHQLLQSIEREPEQPRLVDRLYRRFPEPGLVRLAALGRPLFLGFDRAVSAFSDFAIARTFRSG